MNKYLCKLAETNDEKYARRFGGLAGTGVGTAVINSAYHRGDLTGRATFYHGSTRENTERIKREGIVPRKTRGVIDEINKVSPSGAFAKKNQNLSFATRSKLEAYSYSHQADAIKHHEFYKFRANPANAFAKIFESRLRDVGRDRTGRVSEINIPTWRQSVKRKIVRNPELDNAVFLNPFDRYELDNNTLTHKGTLNSRYIKGGRGYKGNSAGEILKYIKLNPGNFLKGLGKTGVGAGIIAGSAHLAFRKPKHDK